MPHGMAGLLSEIADQAGDILVPSEPEEQENLTSQVEESLEEMGDRYIKILARAVNLVRVEHECRNKNEANDECNVCEVLSLIYGQASLLEDM